MNKSIEARTKPEFYVGYANRLREGGASEAEIRSAIATTIEEAKSLLAGRCPKCGAPSARYVDYKRQDGPCEMPGTWVQYRCSTQPPPGQLRPEGVCDFMADLREGEASN